MKRDGGSPRMTACAVVCALVAGTALTASADEPYLDVVISEMMVRAPGVGGAGEYLELTNRGTVTVDLSGWEIADGIRYAFEPGTTIAPGQRLVIARMPDAAAALYGLTNVFGPYEGGLSRTGERLALHDHNGGLVNEVIYEPSAPWPVGARGDGRSLELVDLANNGNVGRFWKPSLRLGGTPGAANEPGGARPVTVVINEFVARSEVADWVELYNYGDMAVDLNGYYLTDSMDQPTRAQISASWSAGTTVIPPGGYWVSTETDWVTFALNADGESIFLVAPDGITWVDGYDFGNQPVVDASEGRYPDGGDQWVRYLTPSPGSANALPPDRGVVINEIMYHPADETETDPGVEYLELYNLNAFAVDLGGWAFTAGIDYEFAPGTLLFPNGYMVLARDPAAVQSAYGLSGVLGPYSGKLSNRADHLVLRDHLGNIADEVEYRDRGQWPEAPDGDGPSLERATYAIDGRLPGAWRTSVIGGTPGAANSQVLPNPPATIGDDVQHAPLVPNPWQSVTVTARVAAGSLTSVTLFYKRDIDGSQSWNSTPMYDDGQHGDGLAGDGVFGGTIPPYPDGSIVEFYISAQATGGSTLFPPQAPVSNCLYVVEHNTPDSNLNIFRIVITQANHNLIASNPYSDVRRDCTLIFGRAYYNCSVRRRGGSRDWAKHSYKLHMTPGYRFRGADEWDINFEKNDKTQLKNLMIYQLLNELGQPGSTTEFIHTRWRNFYAGVHLLVEPRDSDFLSKHYPEDSDGNLYKAIAPWITSVGGINIAWGGHHSWFEKQSNEQANDWTDLDELHQITHPSYPQAFYESEVRRVVDIVNWGRAYAVLGIGCLIDQPWHVHNQNYRLYRRFSDDRFVTLLHDFDDAYWDTMWASAGPNSTVYADVNRYLEHPPFKREMHHALWRALNLEDGVFREARARTKVAYYHQQIYDDIAADPFSSSSSQNRWTEFLNARNQWDTWLNGRNSLLRSFLAEATLAITTNGGQPITTGSSQLVLEGTAPLSAARLLIDGSDDDIEWLSTTQWRRTITLVDYSSTITVQTADDEGTILDEVWVDVTYTAGVPNDVDFTADVTSGFSPLTVQFTDTSVLQGITERLWEFGDGTTSSEQHPVHTYEYDGVYTVRLTVVGPSGPLLMAKKDYIQVGSPTAALVNPSYEDPAGFLTGWQSCLSGESSIKHNPGTQLPTPRFHDGENSTGMSSDRPGNDLGAGAIYQEVAVTPGRTYRVQFWAAMTNAGGNHYVELRMRDGDSSPLSCPNNGAAIEANSVMYARLNGQAAMTWVPLVGEIVPTQNVITVIAYWKFSGTEWGIKSLHLDDWSLLDLTPGFDPEPPLMAITEYLYLGLSPNGGEFIELTNVGSEPVSMVGWSFDDENRVSGTVDLSAFGIVQPGESVILTEESVQNFRSNWGLGAKVKVIGDLGNPVGNNIGRDDELNLYGPDHSVVDRLTYGDQAFPGSIRAREVSGRVEPEGLMANDPYAWVYSAVGDSQGSWQSVFGDVGSPGTYVAVTFGADLDGDGDVDHEDAGLMQGCFTGPMVLYDVENLPPGCTLTPDGEGYLPADFDRDGDVDQMDFAIFQRCITGEGIPADPDCMN